MASRLAFLVCMTPSNGWPVASCRTGGCVVVKKQTPSLAAPGVQHRCFLGEPGLGGPPGRAARGSGAASQNPSCTGRGDGARTRESAGKGSQPFKPKQAVPFTDQPSPNFLKLKIRLRSTHGSTGPRCVEIMTLQQQL